MEKKYIEIILIAKSIIKFVKFFKNFQDCQVVAASLMC